MMEINAIVFILLLLIALAIGAVVAWFIAFSKGKQLVENKFEQLGKDAKKIVEDAEKEGQAQKRDLIKALKNNNSKLSYTSQIFIDDNSKETGKQFIIKDTITYKKLLKQNIICMSTSIVDKELCFQNNHTCKEGATS